MSYFTVTVRTGASSTTYTALAASSSAAFEAAVDSLNDDPCGVTVIPV